ncbi:hypothetical protein HDU97_001119 [Phlyctochytrium planicorne]|nr:hypothetical protein HDU97_001119 [Phlyctochytrium planicorne]
MTELVTAPPALLQEVSNSSNNSKPSDQESSIALKSVMAPDRPVGQASPASKTHLGDPQRSPNYTPQPGPDQTGSFSKVQSTTANNDAPATMNHDMLVVPPPPTSRSGSQPFFAVERPLSFVMEESTSNRISTSSSPSSEAGSKNATARHSLAEPSRPSMLEPSAKSPKGKDRRSLQIPDSVPLTKRNRSISLSLEWITPRGQTWKPPPHWEETANDTKVASTSPPAQPSSSPPKTSGFKEGGLKVSPTSNTTPSPTTSPNPKPINTRKERAATVGATVGRPVITFDKGTPMTQTPVSAAPSTPSATPSAAAAAMATPVSATPQSGAKEASTPPAGTPVTPSSAARASLHAPHKDHPRMSVGSGTPLISSPLAGGSSGVSSGVSSGRSSSAMTRKLSMSARLGSGTPNPLPLAASRSISTSAMILTTVTPATPLQASTSLQSLTTTSNSTGAVPVVPLKTGAGPSCLGVKLIKSRSRQELKADDSDENQSSFDDCSSINSKPGAPRKSSSSSSLTAAKDRRKFAKIFPDLAKDEDNLLSVYACAWEKDVLLQGKLFITKSHCAFYCNLLGNAQTLLISMSDIVTVEKKSTAGMFPNAIRIVTADNKYVFSSFLKRDNAFTDIVEYWRLSSYAFPDVSPGSAAPDEITDLPPSPSTQQDFSGLPFPRAEEKPSEPTPQVEPSMKPARESYTGEPRIVANVEVKALDANYLDLAGIPEQKKRGRSYTSGAQPNAVNYSELRVAISKMKKDHAREFGDGDASTSDEKEKGTPTTRGNRSATVGLFRKLLYPNESPKGSNHGSASSSQDFTPIHATPVKHSHLDKILIPSEVNSITTTPQALTPDRRRRVRGEQTSSPISATPLSPVRPPEPAKCGCESSHFEHAIISEVVSMDIRDLYVYMFSDVENVGSSAWLEAHRKRESEGMKLGKWVNGSVSSESSDATAVNSSILPGSHREANYNVGFKMPMIQKTTATPCAEKQVVVSASEFSDLHESLRAYTIESVSKTPKVPYGDNFQIVSRYCLTHEGANKSRIVISSKIEFSKKLMLKDRIESASVEGLQTFATYLLESLSHVRVNTSEHRKRIPTMSRVDPDDSEDDRDSISDRNLTRRSEILRKSRVSTPSIDSPLIHYSAVPSLIRSCLSPYLPGFVMVLLEIIAFCSFTLPARVTLRSVNFLVSLLGTGSQIPIPDWIGLVRSPITFVVSLPPAGSTQLPMAAAGAAGGVGGGSGGGGGSPTRQRSKSERRRSRHRNSTNEDLNWRAGSGGGGASGSGGSGGSGGGGGGSGPKNYTSAILVLLIALAVISGVFITTLNVFWIADIGTRLDRALNAVRDAKSGSSSGSGSASGDAPRRGPLSAEERQELEWIRVRSELADAQTRFADRSFSSLVSARRAIGDAGRSTDILRDYLDRIRRNIPAALSDVVAGAAKADDEASGFSSSSSAPGEGATGESADGNNADYRGRQDPLLSLSDTERRMMVHSIVDRILSAAGSEALPAANPDIVPHASEPAVEDIPKPADDIPKPAKEETDT